MLSILATNFFGLFRQSPQQPGKAELIGQSVKTVLEIAKTREARRGLSQGMVFEHTIFADPKIVNETIMLLKMGRCPEWERNVDVRSDSCEGQTTIEIVNRIVSGNNLYDQYDQWEKQIEQLVDKISSLDSWKAENSTKPSFSHKYTLESERSAELNFFLADLTSENQSDSAVKKSVYVDLRQMGDTSIRLYGSPQNITAFIGSLKNLSPKKYQPHDELHSVPVVQMGY